jgi:glycosyltransferase involved in cell wall biosynthesis
MSTVPEIDADSSRDGARGADRDVAVSVVTPFYNTAEYLAECIESVLAQTRGDFEYLLCDNASTDGSGEIARRYAARDPRIRYVHDTEHLPQVENYNRALARISVRSRYVKIVQADDWIYPRCLEEMVAIADANPDVAIVAALYLRGEHVDAAGWGRRPAVYDGRGLARAQLLGLGGHLGSPTVHMFRADCVRARAPRIYATGRYYEDTDLVFELLAEHAVAFVPQVLSGVRTGNESIWESALGHNPVLLSRYLHVEMHVDRFFPPDEARRIRRDIERQYYRYLGTRAASFAGSDFWRYHRKGLATAGLRIARGRVACAALGAALRAALNPLLTLRRILDMRRTRAREALPRFPTPRSAALEPSQRTLTLGMGTTNLPPQSRT